MNAATHLAVLDDEVDITLLLGNYLESHGFRVSRLHSGSALMALMAVDTPALVLLDLGLPGEDGLLIARELRAHWRCGLVIVSGRGDAVDRIVGLEMGADDYVTKPFDLRELVARVKAVLRRMAPAGPAASAAVDAPPAPVAPLVATQTARPCFRFAGWQLDTAARRLQDAQGCEVSLTSGEFDLLHAFLRQPGHVLSRDQLMSQTRGRDAGPFDRTIDVQVGRLRRKLQGSAGVSELIKSVRGAGYILLPAVSVD